MGIQYDNSWIKCIVFEMKRMCIASKLQDWYASPILNYNKSSI